VGLLLFWPAHAEPPVVLLQAVEQGQLLASNVGYQVDEGGLMALDQVLSPQGQAAFEFPQTAFSSKGGPQATWFALRFFQKEARGDWVLSLPATSIQDLRFYGPFDASGRAVQDTVVTGSRLPFATRPLHSEQLSWRMQLNAPGTYTAYVRAVSLTPRTYDFKVWDIAQYVEAVQDKRLFDGICYGIIAAMLVYNLVLLLIFRDRTYALYVVSGLFALLSLASFNGHTAHYIFAKMPLVADRLNVIFPSLWIVFSSLFAYAFLDMKRLASRFGTVAMGVVVAASFLALAGLMGQITVAQKGNQFVAMFGTVNVFVAAVLSWKRGFAPARWYLTGQLALFVAIFGSVLTSWGVIDMPFLSDNGLQTGLAIETVVFAVALGSRIRLMQAMQSELTLKTEQLTLAAETDTLTGVANRAGLAARAHAVLHAPNVPTLILLDLDKFKPVNDVYGHEAGDRVLVAVAQRIRAQLRADDTLARVGGDEFVVLLNRPLARRDLEQIAARLLDAISQPVSFGEQRLTVGASLGVARFPGNGLTLHDLMQAADVAMYYIKKHGRAGVAFVDDLSAQEAQVAAASIAASPNRSDLAGNWDI
jgi:diguanylate cyclase (GGDEF)-like protein